MTPTGAVDGLLRTASVSVGGSADDLFYGLTYDANDTVATQEDIDGTDMFRMLEFTSPTFDWSRAAEDALRSRQSPPPA